jgi:hypothetical protein
MVASWSGTDDDGSTAATNQVTMPAGNREAAVNYAEAPPGGSVEIMVSDADDDVEERLSNGDVARSGVDLELGEDREAQLVGLRFQKVEIPAGANITSASLEFTADETHSGTTNLTIHGQASDDAPAFGPEDYGVSERTRTSATVDWSNVAPWATVHAAYSSPDLSPIIQEIVDRSGWASGNALVLMVSGSGRRTAEAYDGEPNLAPKLHVAFSLAASGLTDTGD